ncbi:actin-like ATPase domain-containing protein [Xylona heveae TC161]|uniref:Phosphotransferase n=1 Tax=Xylona heveae (strain CBS 132557 / TC161) TaxID=1328760 RepID=A0A165H0X4_XYLHT|nr:actin-like ATPase domain-containing protein [Xylona heveae TC161]KZF22847.1 actin-like ATPase domain-containing protein [Xylona heveae TC161]
MLLMLPSLLRASTAPTATNTTTTTIPATATTFHDEETYRLERLQKYALQVTDHFLNPLQMTTLLDISKRLQEQFHNRLQSCRSCMLPSCNHQLPTGREHGTFLTIDVGGSNLRVALVELSGKKEQSPVRIVRVESWQIDHVVRSLPGHVFFDWMASKVGEMLAKDGDRFGRGSGSPLRTGISWSFPLDQISLCCGLLNTMGKGFLAAEGLIGQDLGELISQACLHRNVNIQIEAIVNDSSATLLSRAYVDQSARMALILGTGTNAAIHLPVTSLGPGKFGSRLQDLRPDQRHVLVNTELSMFGKGILPTTRWDEQLTAMHPLPDFQPFEMLISGRYLGEIVRLVLVEAVLSVGLFGGHLPSGFDQPYALDTATIAVIEADESSSLSAVATIFETLHKSHFTSDDLLFTRHVCQLVSRRAAGYLAAGVHALWSLRNTAEAGCVRTATVTTQNTRTSIACTGSVVEKYPHFRRTCQEYLDLLTPCPGLISLDPVQDCSILGAAIAVACCDAENSSC